jgi:hypothetical protein
VIGESLEKRVLDEKSGKVVKVKISTISTHKSHSYGYVKMLRSEFWMKKWKSGRSQNK